MLSLCNSVHSRINPGDADRNGSSIERSPDIRDKIMRARGSDVKRKPIPLCHCGICGINCLAAMLDSSAKNNCPASARSAISVRALALAIGTPPELQHPLAAFIQRVRLVREALSGRLSTSSSVQE